MKRVCLGLIIASGIGFGQSQNVVIRNLVSGLTTAPYSAVVPSSGMIGQGSHFVMVQYFDAPAHTCTTPAGVWNLQGAFTSTGPWIPITYGVTYLEGGL